MEELLKLTCNPKVGPGSTFSFSTIEERYILTCRLIRLSVRATARSTGRAGPDACSLLPQPQPAVGTQHQGRFHSVGVLQQESGELKPSRKHRN